MKKFKKNKGILFWITGLPGSGKTSIAKEIFPYVKKKFGQTILISGDDLRKLFKLKSFSKENRLSYALFYSKICKLLTDKNINVILATVALFNSVRNWNKHNINNYLEIYIKADIENVINKKKKYFYKKKSKNVVGKDLKAEFPKTPDIILKNNFKKSIKKLSKELIGKI